MHENERNLQILFSRDSKTLIRLRIHAKQQIFTLQVFEEGRLSCHTVDCWVLCHHHRYLCLIENRTEEIHRESKGWCSELLKLVWQESTNTFDSTKNICFEKWPLL